MIGVVVAGYGSFGTSLIQGVQTLEGPQAQMIAVDVDRHGDVEAQRRLLVQAITSVDEGEGTLVLTDSLGETAANLTQSVLDQAIAKMVAGANLPMLAAVVAARTEPTSTHALATVAVEAGRSGISQLTAAL